MLRQILRSSAVLVVAVSVLTVAIHLTGLHRRFPLGQTLFIAGAISINLFVVYGALAARATEFRYRQQIFLALGIGVVAGALIVLSSWLLLTFVFPDAVEQMRQAALETLRAADMPAAEFERQKEVLDAATPLSQAIPGGLGTLTTSLIAGLGIGWFRSRR